MKTITLQGREKQINNFILENELLQIREDKFQLVETRVYVLDIDSLDSNSADELSDDEFQSLAEEQGRVYTLEGFQQDFNLGEINSSIDFIRIVNVIL